MKFEHKGVRCFLLLPGFVAFSYLPAAMAQNKGLFEGADTVHLYVEMNGSFNNQSQWNVNLVNAPNTAFQSKPADSEIPQETFKILNKYSKNILKEVIENSGFKKTSWNKKDFKNWRGFTEPLFTPGGDRYYRIEIIIAGDNGLGGRYGGLDVRLYFKSMHRSTDVVYGYSFQTLHIGLTDEETLSNLKNMFSEMLKESYGDWQMSLEKDLKSPRRYLLLKFEVSELSTKQKKFVRTVLFPCLYSRADSLGYVDLNNFYYQIFYRLTKTEEGENEEEYISYYADRLQFSMGSSGKYPCSLSKTPMENYRATAKIDTAQKLITIGWRKP